MAIAKMKRLELVALQSDRETLMEALLRLGCVEIREPEEQPELLHRQSSSLAERQSDLRRLTAALDALSRAAPEKTPLLAARPQISEKAFLDEKDLPAMLALADEITGRLRRISQLESRMTRLTSDEAALRPWQALDIPLELEYTGPVAFITGTLPPTADEAQVEGTLAEQAPESQVFWLSAGREQKCLLLMTHRAAQAAALETLRSFGFSTGQLKGYSGTVQENLRRIEGEINDTRQARREESEALEALGARRGELRLACDRMALELSRQEAAEKLLTDGNIFCLVGWYPLKAEKKLTTLLGRFDCAYELAEPQPEEYPDVPVKLESNRFTRSMNCITEQYSLPAYDGVDPNPFMAPFFILFFGLMMADMAYGLLMIFGSLLFLRKKRPADPSFMEMIFWCGIATFLFGALTGGFFGDFIPQLCRLINPASTFDLPALFSPLNDTMAIMVGSLVLGAIQIFTGMTISVVKKTRDGHFADALWYEITWWIILAGLAMAIFKVGTVAGVPVVLVIGILMLAYGSGRGKKGFGKVTGFVAAVYNGVTGFFSDIMSYIRLMALMLSGAVLAQVFNKLGATTGSIVFFIVISLVGNTLNLALNLLGCYVHDMRLQFLEFFGRFYKEGGKAYRPLCVQSKYVEIMKEDTEK